VAEVAAATSLSETTVKVTVHRGLKGLLARFGGWQLTDELIARLADDLRPVPAYALVRRLVVAALWAWSSRPR
jgi:hypothetical protein